MADIRTALGMNPGLLYDNHVDAAVRAFQQKQGMTVDGVVGPETWRALQESTRHLGDRILQLSVTQHYTGDDVRELQMQLVSLGFDAGRIDGSLGERTDHALRDFQRNVGLSADGVCGPATLRAFARLTRSVRGGNAHELRESERIRRAGPGLSDKHVVIDPGGDLAYSFGDLTASEVVRDVAARLEGRLAAAGATVSLTSGPGAPVADELTRADFANRTQADLVVSLHVATHTSPAPQGSATYYFGRDLEHGSVVGERLAGLIQREVVARTDLMDGRTQPKTWPLLRATRMPAVRLEMGYLSNPHDAVQLASPRVRDAVAEAVLVAVQRLFLPADLDPPTGTIRLPADMFR